MATDAVLLPRFSWDYNSLCFCPISSSLGSPQRWSLLSASRFILRSTSVSSSILPPSSLDTSENRGDEANVGGLHDEVSAQEDAMILALQERKTDEAWRLYELLMRKKHVPNSVCLSRLVSQLSYAGSPSSLTKAQRLVASLQKRRMVDLLDCNSLGLLAMATAKAGAERYAASIIRSMLKLGYHPHVKAWSAVVSKLGKSKEDVSLALSIFEEICSTVREVETISQFQGDSVSSVTAMRPDTAAFNAALNACANAGLVDKACDILADLPRFHLKPDVLTFNILIKMYAMSDNIDKLCTILGEMEAAGVHPDLSTMHSLVAAFVGLDDLETAVTLVQALRDGGDNIGDILFSKMETLSAEEPEGECLQEDDVDAVSEMVVTETVSSAASSDFFVNKDGEDNLSTKRRNPKFRFKPDTRMYTILMKGYMQKGRLTDVLQILSAMQNQGSTETLPNEVSYTTAISTCVRLGLLDEARSVLLQMAAQNVPANVVTYNVLLNGYSKERQIPKGRLLLEDMKKAGIQPDVVSYNTLIDGYISIDDSVSALALFTEMRNAGIAPSRVSYTMLIKAFGNNGQPHLAAKVFEEMEQDRRVKVDTIAWNTLIECYSKAGDADGAKQSFQRMKECGNVPTVATYGSLLKAFSVGKKTGEALVLWKEVKDRLEPDGAAEGSRSSDGRIRIPLEPDAGLLDGFVDMCVREGLFLKALEIVACMEKYNIPADRIKYKRMFVELHSKLYTSKYTSQARRDRTADRRRAVEAFKFWLGLPNDYYARDWSP